jgi:prevent-host-death family protein
MGNHRWTVAEAEARSGERIEQARVEGPQTIIKHGRKADVVVSAEEWEIWSSRAGTLAEFFAASPLRASGSEIERREDGPRQVDL